MFPNLFVHWVTFSHHWHEYYYVKYAYYLFEIHVMHNMWKKLALQEILLRNSYKLVGRSRISAEFSKIGGKHNVAALWLLNAIRENL